VEIGNDVEGVLPVKFQNSAEHFDSGDRIKALVTDVRKTSSALQLVLSRIDPNLVKNILELEVPELADKTVEIKKIVRDAGYRTKIAVYTSHENVDPVGACVGMKGSRIQSVIKEIDGEKIDVLRYDEDPTKFIANALSPATVNRVIVTDAEKRSALAIVPDTQFSLAIGRQGHNVRLANRLCDWTIDVKTESQAAEIDLSEFVRNAPFLSEVPEDVAQESQEPAVVAETDSDEDEGISVVSDIPEIDGSVAEILKSSKYDDIQTFVDAYYDGSLLESGLLTKEQVDSAFEIITKYVEIVDDDSEQPEE
jgi:N utilization substance protein A